MRYLLLICLAALLFVSCEKKEVVLPKTGSKGIPVFPLKKGNVWEVTQTYYLLDGTVRGSGTYMDTTTNSMTIDGFEFYAVGGESYHLVDNNTFERAGDRSTAGLEKKYVDYRYSDGIDTLWKESAYGEFVIGDSFFCIAYPYETVINGMKCRRTETRGYIYNERLPYMSFKRVLYCSLGYGPVFEQVYESDGTQLYKMRETSYKPVLVNYDKE